MRAIKRLAYLLLALVLVIVTAVAVLGVLALDREPLVVDGVEGKGFTIVRAKSVARRTLYTLTAYGNESSLTLGDADVAAVLVYAARVVPGATSKAEITEAGMASAVTLPLPLPDTPLGRYVNVAISMEPSQDGLRLRRIGLGSLYAIDGETALNAARVLGDHAAGDDIVSHVIDSVRTVEMQPESMLITFKPLGPRGSELRGALESLLGK